MRRPAGFFQHLLAREAEPIAAMPAELRGVLAGHDELCRRLEGSRAEAGALIAPEHGAGEGVVHSAALSQRHYLDEDYRGGETLFPAHRYDEDRQQVDLRETNSHISMDVDTAALPEVLRHLTDAGVRSLVSQPPTLEELFLRHYDQASGQKVIS